MKIKHEEPGESNFWNARCSTWTWSDVNLFFNEQSVVPQGDYHHLRFRTLFLSGVPLAHKYIPHHWKACSELTLPVNACSRSEIAKRLSALILTWGLGIDVPLPERERLGIKFHCWGGALGRHITGGTNVEPAGSPKVTCSVARVRPGVTGYWRNSTYSIWIAYNPMERQLNSPILVTSNNRPIIAPISPLPHSSFL